MTKTRISAPLLAFSVALAPLMLAATPALAQATATATQPARYSAAQFFQTTAYAMPAPAGLAFSPDGANLLVASDATGVFNAKLLPVNGAAPVVQTNSTTNAVFVASFFPKDGRMIVVSDQGGNELDHVYVRETDGTLKDLTPGDKVKADFLGWTQDRSTIYLTSNARDPAAFDLLAVDPTTYKTTIVFENPGFELADVSPDGRWLALVKPITSANSDVYLVDLKGDRKPVLITEHTGNVAFGVYDFTPDSKGLVLATNEEGEFNQAWKHDIATGKRTPYIKADWDVMYAFYSPTGRYRVHALNVDASTQLTVTDLTTGKPVALSGIPAGDVGGVRFSEDDSQIAFTVASDTSPADVFVASLKDGKARRLTRALNPAIKETDLVEAQIVRYTAEGGVQIPSVLYVPKGASATNKVPAIVFVHGGPGGQTRRGYSAMMQHLVNHGYAVLGANNRGSSGYGKTFFHMDDRRHGEADLRDIVAGGDWLRAQPWVDPDRVVVMGGSYGGYMTAAALAFHPEAFEAGINIFGVTNWVRTLQSIPAWWGPMRDALYDEMGDPAKDAERHRRISPLFHADKIRRPMLVVQGANDPRVLQIESDELVAAVRKNNVPVEYVIFPDEGHGFLRKENRITAQEAYLNFLEKHVGKKAASAAADK